MKNNLEFKEMARLLKGMPRTKSQLNALFEADCEILKIPGGFLSCSTDSIGEEIDIQLYQDPELWGWMSVMSSVSDLAASGSQALGLLLTNQWKYKTSAEEKQKFFSGVTKALKKSKVPLLGGDSGSGESHCHSTTILGRSQKKPLTRKGVKPGDILCLVGSQQLGCGPALAYRFLFQKSSELFPENFFRPEPALSLMQKIRPWVNAAIDTSDGLATSLQILGELNGVGFDLQWNPRAMSKKALQFCAEIDLHPLMLVMGDHGDYQSLIAVSPKNLKKVLSFSKEIIPLGQATKTKKQFHMQYESQSFQLPVELVTTCPRDVQSILDLSLEANKLFKSHSSPTSPAMSPAKRMTPKTLGEEK